MKTRVDIRFERIAEEFAPPAPKPESVLRSIRSEYRTADYGGGLPSVPQVIAQAGPQWDTLRIRITVGREVGRQANSDPYAVVRQIADALANALLKYITIEKEQNQALDAIDYTGTVHVAKMRPRSDTRMPSRPKYDVPFPYDIA